MPSYPFTRSHVDLGLARGPRLAFLIHLAEGGNTVAYLSRPNPNGVSVHYVIERSGRTVQMLDLSRMHSSIRVSAIRTTDDPDGLYGATAARAVMGKWADLRHGTLGPNHASIAVEVEGFAKDGPNTSQRAALRELWADLRGRYPGIRALGHRDFTTQKACPGKLIGWEDFGGHGAAKPEPVPATPTVPPELPSRPAPASLEDPVVIVTEFAERRVGDIPADTRSFSFDPRTAAFAELSAIGPGPVEIDGQVVFLRRPTAPRGTFLRIVTGPAGRRLVSAGAVSEGGTP